MNPGLLLYNIGLDSEITPKLRVSANASYMQFDDPEVLREILFDDKISDSIGVDLSVSAQYRPFQNNNCILTAGLGVLLPGDGFADLYADEAVYSTFMSCTLTY